MTILRSVYYAIFEYHLCYASYVRVQNTNSVKRLHLLHKKSLRIMFFQSRNPIQAIYLKFPKFLSPLIRQTLKTALFNSKSLKMLLPSFFIDWITFYFEPHSHDTRWWNLGYLKILSYRTKTYNIIDIQCI